MQRFSEIPDSEIDSDSRVTDIFAIPKLKFCIKKAQRKGHSQLIRYFRKPL